MLELFQTDLHRPTVRSSHCLVRGFVLVWNLEFIKLVENSVPFSRPRIFKRVSDLFYGFAPNKQKVYIMYNYTYKFQFFPGFFYKISSFSLIFFYKSPGFSIIFFYKIPGFSRFYGHTFSNTWNSKKVGIKFIMLNILNVIPTFLLFQ